MRAMNAGFHPLIPLPLGEGLGEGYGPKPLSLTAPLPFLMIVKASGSNSVVECNLAKVEVAGSNPVSRSMNS